VPFGRCDLELASDVWSEFMVGKCSKNYEIESLDDLTRHNAEKAFCDEIRFVCHLSVESFIIPIYEPNNSNLARILNSFLQNEHRLQYFKVNLKKNITKSSYKFKVSSLQFNFQCGIILEMICYLTK
jgi:hypothetical protein